MSKIDDLATLRTLVEVKYRQQQESFARLMAQENRLRGALRQLDAQMAESRSNACAQQQAIGADVLWQAWVGRKKRELNMQLAKVLAVKERHVAQVRSAYGKVLVTDKLHRDACAQAQQKKAQSELDRAIASMLFRGPQ